MAQHAVGELDTTPIHPSQYSLDPSKSHDNLAIIGSALRSSSLFLTTPSTDPLANLLARHVPIDQRPPRDVKGAWQNHDASELIMSNSWRALAAMAHEKLLLRSVPLELDEILDLWCIRLSSLARMRLFNQASAESANLWTVLGDMHATGDRQDAINNSIPFELLLLRARAKVWANDSYGYLDELATLLRICKTRAKQPAMLGNQDVWKDHACRINLLIAGQLLDFQDFRGARKILSALLGTGPPSQALLSAITRTNLQSGDVRLARESSVAKLPNGDTFTNESILALQATAEGRWDDAVAILQALLGRDSENLTAINNLTVALLGSGRVEEATQTLEKALKTFPSSFVVAEPLLFNLATLYELKSSTASIKKRELLVEAAKWSGDGIQSTCLKLQAS